MAKFSIIDIDKQDFLHDINGDVLILYKNNEIEVEKWLLENGEKFAWTKGKVEYYNWDKFLNDENEIIEKIKKLDFISLKETDKLDGIECFFYDIENQNIKGLTKYVSCGTINIDDIKTLPNIIKDLFIRNVNQILKKENIFNIETKLLSKIDVTNIIDDCLDDVLMKYPTFKNNERFIIISENLKDKKLINYEKNNNYDLSMFDNGVITSDKIENEIIFGYKTHIYQPGIILISNEIGLSDKNNIRFAISEIGYNPNTPYFKIKIN